MATFTSTALVKQTKAKGIDPGTRIDKYGYFCYMGVVVTTVYNMNFFF